MSNLPLTGITPVSGILLPLPEPLIPRREAFGPFFASSDARWLADIKTFERTKSKTRRTAIRVAVGDEFEPDLGTLFPPPCVWIQVIRVGGFHYRLPFWRGELPPDLKFGSDEEVASFVAQCQREGGYDKPQLDQWRSMVLAMARGRG